MNIEFAKVTQEVRILDPRQDFAETSFSFELRTDPLTQHQGRVISYKFALPEKPNLSELIEKTRPICPFCPEVIDKFATRFPPDFIPDGKITLGDVTVVPNLMPYSKYGAVAALSKKHFLGIDELTEETMVNGFLACQTYFKKVLEYEPEAKYHTIGWNYLPVAGGSIVHPHLQAEADCYPFQYHREILDASRKCAQKNSGSFWASLLDRERDLGDRYVSTIGDVVWLVPFVSRGKIMPDIMAVFKERDSIVSITESEWKNFAVGLRKVLDYFGDLNFYSFNMAIYSGTLGQNYFWTNARVSARGYFPPANVSDHDHIQRFQDEYCTCRIPEEVCTELREYFSKK